MKKLSSIFATFAVSTVSVFGLGTGDSIPKVTTSLRDSVTGKSLRLQNVRNKKGTLVIFTCNECPYARAWQDRLVALGNEYSTKGFQVFAINSNDPKANDAESLETMKAIAEKNKMKFPYASDETSDIARLFGASRTPETYLFDANGKLVFQGAIDDNAQDPKAVKKSYLREALEDVLAGRAVKVHEATAMGCGIKFRKKS